MSATKSLDSKDEYSIGWICALSIERAAATALLDEHHGKPLDFLQHKSDNNSYTWGRIQDHNIVIASLPAGVTGLISATRTVQCLITSLPHIRIGLLVGIGAGVPESGFDIRLGDVAVSRPNGTTSGVIQYDSGKAKSNGWERTGMLAPPPDVLLHALAKLESEHELYGTRISQILRNAGSSNSVFADNYKHPELKEDQTLQKHNHSAKRRKLDSTTLLDTSPQIHYGTIGSGNTLVKDAQKRKEIIKSIGPCVCLEMEAAGLMNNFPCLVIRGISDYADLNKNDVWQRYASATAAAFAKELLLHVPKTDVESSQRIKEVFGYVQPSIDSVAVNMRQVQKHKDQKKTSDFLRVLYDKTCPYEGRKNRNTTRIAGTCEWFTHHPLYTKWRDRKPSLLWVSADPGCGKSVLARFLVDEFSKDANKVVCYFFFKDDYTDQRTASSAACALLRQSLIQSSQNATQKILQSYYNSYFESFKDAWDAFIETSLLSSRETICVLDAMDECRASDQHQVISIICELYSTSNNFKTKVKILVTSRSYTSIVDAFYARKTLIPIIHLNGDNDEEKEAISKEIDIVIKHRIHSFGAYRRLLPGETEFLLERFLAVPQRTYLWAHLTLTLLEETSGFTKGGANEMMTILPPTVTAAYNKILNRSTNLEKTKLVLHLILAAKEPLTPRKLAYLLALDRTYKSCKELQDFIEPEDRFKDTIRQLCGLFVTVVDSKVYLLHQTAREFLVSTISGQDGQLATGVQNNIAENANSLQNEWKATMHVAESNLIMAERSLRILRLDPIPWGDIPLIYHIRRTSIDAGHPIIDLALDVFDSLRTYWLNKWLWLEISKFKGWSPNRWSPNNHSVRNPRHYGGSINLISLVGVPQILQKYIDKNKHIGWNRRELSEALWWAAISGSVETARLLLQLGARTTILALFGYNDWAYAYYEFYDEEFLNEQMPIYDQHPNTTLIDTISIAIEAGNEAMIDLLLQYNDRTKIISEETQKILRIGAYFEESLLQYEEELLSPEEDFLVREETPSIHKYYKYDWNYLLQRQAEDFSPWIKEELPMPEKELLLYEEELPSYQKDLLLYEEELLSYQKDLLAQKESLAILDAMSQAFPTLPLLEAARNGDVEIVQQLLQTGADVEDVDESQVSAMMLSAGPNSSLTTMEILFGEGANLEAKDCQGASCIHYARRLDALEYLVAHGVDINTQDGLGRTCLVSLVEEGNWIEKPRVDLIRYMLQLGADQTIRDKRGGTAMSYAQENFDLDGDSSYLDVLKQSGVVV